MLVLGAFFAPSMEAAHDLDASPLALACWPEWMSSGISDGLAGGDIGEKASSRVPGSLPALPM